jgi:hypothetical protein
MPGGLRGAERRLLRQKGPHVMDTSCDIGLAECINTVLQIDRSRADWTRTLLERTAIGLREWRPRDSLPRDA